MNNKPNYIIVLGTTYSGSGAVSDYLRGRGDLSDPLMGKEYLLPQSPGGLMCLEAAAGQAFHHATSDRAVIEFLKLSKMLARKPTKTSYGDNLTKYLPEFLNLIEELIKSIVVSRFSMRLLWHRMNKSPFNRFLELAMHKVGWPNPPEPAYILSSADDIVQSIRKFHDELFDVVNSKKIVLLDQAGSGWNPVNSTKYFTHRRVVLVERDPRDQFAELKKYKGANDVYEFINWYTSMQSRINSIDSELVFRIKFEDFVKNSTDYIDDLCNFLSIDKDIESTYDSNKSIKNIGMYKPELTAKEISIIERGCNLK